MKKESKSNSPNSPKTMKTSGLVINPEFSAKIKEFFLENSDDLSRISKKHTELLHSQHFELKKFFIPTFKIMLSCKSPQDISERLQTETEYFPKSSETIIGPNVAWQNKKPEILLQIKKKVQLVLLQDDNSIKIYEKFNEPRSLKPLSRLEIQGELQIQTGDLFRIGKTIIEIEEVTRNLICVSFMNKTSSGKNLVFSSDFTIGKGSSDSINIKDFMACEAHATIAYQGYWVIKNNQRLNRIWKYLAVKDNLGEINDSPTYQLRNNQLVYISGYILRLKLDDETE